MSILSNICKHCGKKKEDHYPQVKNPRYFFCFRVGPSEFFDSGLSRLHDHAEELYAALDEIVHVTQVDNKHPEFPLFSALRRANEVLSKINPKP